MACLKVVILSENTVSDAAKVSNKQTKKRPYEISN